MLDLFAYEPSSKVYLLKINENLFRSVSFLTFPRSKLTISFPSLHVKNRDYFAFLHKSSGHRNTPHKTGTYGHPSIVQFLRVDIEEGEAEMSSWRALSSILTTPRS